MSTITKKHKEARAKVDRTKNAKGMDAPTGSTPVRSTKGGLP